MTNEGFKPTVYLLQPCPFCLKFMIFLEESGLLDQFEIKSFMPGTPDGAAIRAELEPHLEKVTFPVVQVAPGEYLNDTEALMKYYAQKASKPPEDMRLLNYYISGVFPAYGQLFQENRALKAAAVQPR